MSELPIAQRFLELHRSGDPLLLPNPWDVGSAVLLASLGFAALATTSSGHAATFGRLDGAVTRSEALAHAAALAAATDVPVAADFENGFADAPEAVAELVVDPATDGPRWRHPARFVRLRPDLRPSDLHPTDLTPAATATAAPAAGGAEQPTTGKGRAEAS